MRTLRFKLTLLYLAVFGVIQTGMGLLVLAVRQHELRDDMDERLADRARSVVEAIQARPRGDGLPGGDEASGFEFQLRRADGTVVARAGQAGRGELPWTRPGDDHDAPRLHTEAGVSPEGRRVRVRVLTSPVDGDGAAYLQVARSLEHVEEAIADLRRLMALVIPLGLVLAAAASWLAAGRALAPIGRIVRQARALTAASLDRRLDVPAGRDELSDLARTVNDMLDRLERSFRAQQRFLANVSHELKTPISILLGEAEVLVRRERSTDEYRQFVETLLDEMGHLARVVESLLVLARADAGLPVALAGPTFIDDAVLDAVSHCRLLAARHDVLLTTRLTGARDGTGPVIAGDEQLIQVLVENLLRNAIAHSPRGEEVLVEVEVGNGRAVIIVSDRGPGLHGAGLPALFETAPAEGRARRGGGLGLAMVRSIADAHGGAISVTSPEAGGCEFRVDLATGSGAGAGSQEGDNSQAAG